MYLACFGGGTPQRRYRGMGEAMELLSVELRVVQVSVAGSYTSAEGSVLSPAPFPPETSTLPLPSSVAVCPQRGEDMSLTDDQVWVAGSYTSAVLSAALLPSHPPVTRTLPLLSSVDV